MSLEGPFFLTKLLMPAILAGKETHPDHHSRIITVSSSASHLCGDIKFDTFKDGPARRKLSPMEHYSQTKLVSTFWAQCVDYCKAEVRRRISWSRANMQSGMQTRE